MVIVDDALLLALLAGQEGISEALLIPAADDGEVFTTGAWYWRLAGSWIGLVAAHYPVLSRRAPRTSSAGCITPWTNCQPKSAC